MGCVLYNCTIVDNETVGYDTADEQYIPATEGEEGAWYDEWDDCWYKTVRGHYDDYGDFVPIGDDEGWEPGPIMDGCDVFKSIIWGNRSRGSVANVALVTDAKTGQTVAGDYMNHTAYAEWDEAYHEYKPYCTMMNSLVEDFLVEQKGNGTEWKGSGRYRYRVTYKNSTGNITGDPLFIDPDNGDYHLSPSSPCVNAGDWTVWGATRAEVKAFGDLAGSPRLVGPEVDLGCLEAQTAFTLFLVK